jgi:hypothetical protein
MKIKYIGTPGEDHQSIHMYGTDFPLGKFVAVTDSLALRKLSNHPHFESHPEPSDVVEDAKIKNEFVAVASAALAPVEEQHVAAVLAEGENHGNADGPVSASAAEAEGAGVQRARGRGRPRKSN